MKLNKIVKKSLPIISRNKFKILSSIVLSLISAVSGGLSVGLIIPLIDNNSREIFEELGIGFLSNIIEIGFIATEADKVRFLAVLIILLSIFEGITTIFSGFISVSMSSEITKEVQFKLLRKHYQLNQKFSDKQDPGYLLSVFSNNSQNIGFLFGQILNGVKNIFSVIIYSYALFMVSIQMTIGAFLLLGILSTILKAYFGSKLKTQSERTIQSLEILNSEFMENIRNIKFIKSSGRWMEFERRVKKNINFYQDNIVKQNNINIVSNPIFNSFNAIAIALLLIAGTFIIDRPVEEWIALMVPFVIIVFRLSVPINSLNTLRIRIEGIYPDLLRILDYLDNSKSQIFKNGTKEFVSFKRSITFKDVYFKYSNDSNFGVKQANLEFKAFNTTALVGPSGGGKSTIVDMLLNMYSYDQGEITFDDIEINEFDRNSLQKNIAYVSQEPVLFNTSISNNLKWFNPEASSEEVIEATKKAKIYEFILTLENQFEYEIQLNGANLSGGQKQRMAIARAILSKAKIIVLDEATSQVDMSSESEIYEILNSIKSTKTIIYVAHRLSALRNVDKIIIIEDGLVKESGTHEELIKFENFYSKSLAE